MPQNAIPAYTAINPSKFAGPLRTGPEMELLNAQLHAAYYEQVFSGVAGAAANPSGVTLSAGLATTYVGLCLNNPIASKVNLVVNRVSGLLEVAPAALTALGLIVGSSAAGIVTHTTPLTPLHDFVGNAAVAALQGLVDSACTLVGSPAWERWLAVTPGTTSVVSFSDDVAGSIIIAPGGYCAIGASIAGPASGFLGTFRWEEVPLAG